VSRINISVHIVHLVFVVSSELEADPEDEAPEIDDEEVELKEK